jgi:spermidine synthase
LVFVLNGAVLVLEILAVRLLAPYVGLSLEAYTAIIGVVLAGISAGTWAGGKLADAVDPRRVLGPVVLLGGLLALATVPAVRELGDFAEGGTWYRLGFVVGVSFFLPTAVLSAVNPLVVKLQLQSLGETGRIVGRLSALGTAGAIAGTFITGFVLLPSFRTSRVVLVLGLALAILGLALAARAGLGSGARRGSGRTAFLVLSSLPALALSFVLVKGEARCEIETAYFCANVTSYSGPADPSRRVLELDTLQHALVDVDDPTFLGFAYVQRFADVVDVMRPRGAPLNALHIGGGGFTLPRYIAATRPGSRNLTLEIDPGVVRIARKRLGLRTGPRMRVRVGDGRVEVREIRRKSYDLAIGDAFAGVSIPWHLTTREAFRDVRETLPRRGIYLLNIIDEPPLAFLRAETRTLMSAFRHVALVAQPSLRSGVLGTSNYVLLASDAPLPLERLAARIAERRVTDSVVAGEPLHRFVRSAEVLTDDHAPADQLLTRRTAEP